MPGKSKHGKGKRPQNRNRVRKSVSPAAANTAGTMAATATGTPTGAPAAAGVNTASAPARSSKGTAAKTLVYNGATKEQYPFFTSELRRIAVITGAILIILVVLSLVIN
jgi:hypothetical protein